MDVGFPNFSKIFAKFPNKMALTMATESVVTILGQGNSTHPSVKISIYCVRPPIRHSIVALYYRYLQTVLF